MIQVGAREAERSLVLNQSDPGVVSQFFAALVAGGVLVGDEDF